MINSFSCQINIFSTRGINIEKNYICRIPTSQTRAAHPSHRRFGKRGGEQWWSFGRWNREDLLKKCALASRGFGFVFSFLAFVIMASNKHGDWEDFDKYDEYRYVLAIAILATLYTGLQSSRQIHELCTGREVFSGRIFAILDFCGDQTMAYLLISSVSSAIPLTNRLREWADNIFTDASASAISMGFFAFFVLAFSSLLSGYKLSKQPYI